MVLIHAAGALRRVSRYRKGTGERAAVFPATRQSPEGTMFEFSEAASNHPGTRTRGVHAS